MSKRTAKQILKSDEPIQTTITIRTQQGLQVMALCREKNVSVSSLMDALLDQFGQDLVDSEGQDITIPSRDFKWPNKAGLR